MKKISSLLFVVALVLFAACDDYNDDNFKGLEEMVEPTNPGPFELVYTGAPFSADKPAKDKIPDWLSTQLSNADTGAIAIVKYQYKEAITQSYFMVDFEKESLSAAGWQNIAEEGTYYWTDVYRNGNAYVQFSANKAPGVCKAWMVSPKYRIPEGAAFSFDVCVGYYNADCLKVLISTNYNGSVEGAKWTDVTSSFTFPQKTGGYSDMVNAGTLDLATYKDKYVTFAFLYEGDGQNNKTTTYQIDNITVSEPGEKIVENSDEYAFRGYERNWEFVRTVPKYAISETFDGAGESGKPTALNGWLNVALQGDYTWTTKAYSGNFYSQFSANKAPGVCEGWLITPALAVKENMIFSFSVCVGYYNADCLQVMISTDFDGTEEHITDAQWKDVTAEFTIPKEPTSGYGTFAPAGSVSLKEFEGKNIYIGFKYLGDGTDNKTTTYQVDDVFVGVK